MITQLQELAPPPASPVYAGTGREWSAVEQRLGTGLPEDYKQIVNLYGAGSFGEYVCLLNPFVPELGANSYLSLFRGFKDLSGIEPFQRDNPEFFQPFPVYPSPGGLLPWGRECSDAGLQCWRTEGTLTIWSSVILDSDWSHEYHEYSTTMTGFLVGWLTGKIAISYYPSSPLPLPLFQPLNVEED